MLASITGLLLPPGKMDDQFGGRTDDDLFFDDFEPVSSNAQAVPKQAVEQPIAEPIRPEPTVEPPVATNAPLPSVLDAEIDSRPDPPSLANSRHNPNRSAPRPPRQNSTTFAPPPPSVPAATPAHKDKVAAGQATPAVAISSAARLGSGANPRTKLTDDELTAKLAQMRILNAEKARQFERAEQDERSHAEAYAKGMEEARRRRQQDEERRKRGEEDRKRMEDEREKNRERKLKAMGMKEGGWDEGKEAVPEEERRVFRGANGGVRGARMVGLAGSRFANAQDPEPPTDGFVGDGRPRGRGRGRGASRGRGGRGGFAGERNGNGAPPANASSLNSKAKPSLTTTDFPALPVSENKPAKEVEPIPKIEIPIRQVSTTAAPPPLSPPIGKWDDEMEAMDAKLAAAKP